MSQLLLFTMNRALAGSVRRTVPSNEAVFRNTMTVSGECDELGASDASGFLCRCGFCVAVHPICLALSRVAGQHSVTNIY